MRRKVILHGPSTLTISLPSSWVKKQGVKKGDEIDISFVNDWLKIKSTNEPKKKNIFIDIKNNKRTGRSYITSTYRQGWDELNLKFNEPKYISEIQSTISEQLVGFEIIKQNDTSCTIKDLSGMSDTEFETALRRTWLLTLELAKSSINAINNQDSELLKNIPSRDRSINKFSNYCLRYINKKGYKQGKNTAYYFFIRHLEEIADEFHYMSQSCNKYKPPKEIKQIFNQILKSMEKLYATFYKYNDKIIEELFKDTKKILNTLSEKLNSSSKNPALINHLYNISSRIRKTLSTIIEINISE